MSMESDGKEAAITDLLAGWEASNRLSRRNLSAYFRSVETVSLEAVKRTCIAYGEGRVQGHDMAYMPSAPQIAAKAREFDEVKGGIVADEIVRMISYPMGQKPPPGYQSLLEFEEARNKHAEANRDKTAARIPKPKLKRVTDK